MAHTSAHGSQENTYLIMFWRLMINQTCKKKTILELSDIFLQHVQRRLSQRTGQHFYIYISLESFRYFFNDKGTNFPNGSKKLEAVDFCRLVLPTEWYSFIYSVTGDGRVIEFPISIKPVIRWTKKCYTCTGIHNSKKLVPGLRKPIEVWRIEFCTKRYGCIWIDVCVRTLN